MQAELFRQNSQHQFDGKKAQVFPEASTRTNAEWQIGELPVLAGMFPPLGDEFFGIIEKLCVALEHPLTHQHLGPRRNCMSAYLRVPNHVAKHLPDGWVEPQGLLHYAVAINQPFCFRQTWAPGYDYRFHF